jgi:hypothetical protein
MSRAAEDRARNASRIPPKLFAEYVTTILFRGGKIVEPVPHVRMAAVYTEATINDLRHAPSRREERIEMRIK